MSTPRATKGRMRSAGIAALLLLVGCQHSTEVVTSLESEAGTPEMDAALDAGPEAGPDATTPDAAPEGGTTWCKDQLCQCDNGLDDDDDGLIDGFDPECTGPFDKDEGSFSIGVPSGNPKCDDCYFDESGNSNDDECEVAAHCSVDGTPAGAPASCNQCEPSGDCVNNCKPRTPNGCDCFGCCDIPFQGGTVRVKLADTCTMKDLGDPQRCPPCVIPENADCYNPCERCELCAGKTSLPSGCGSNTCADGRTCKLTSECRATEYCTHGCCVEYVY
ncbi:MAG TPA: hypothetical protein VFZ61_16465 [Polyangiales bacterium]